LGDDGGDDEVDAAATVDVDDEEDEDSCGKLASMSLGLRQWGHI
jgi:hypothetical protein